MHGDKYDYSKIEYKNNYTKVCIICPIHGEFWQLPNNHLAGRGCPMCAGFKTQISGCVLRHKKMTTEEFIKKSQKIHENKYDYSKTEYKGIYEKICYICPEHGEIWQLPNNHLQGHGCYKCAKEKVKL